MKKKVKAKPNGEAAVARRASGQGRVRTPTATLKTTKEALRCIRVQVITLMGNTEYMLAMLDQLTADIRKIESTKIGAYTETHFTPVGTL